MVNSLRCHERRTGLFIHKYATAPGRRPTIPSAHLWLYLLPPRPPLLCTLLSYPLTLHYPTRRPCTTLHILSIILAAILNPPTSPSTLSRVPATPLLQMPRKCRYLRTAVKSKKRGLSPVASFLCLRTRTAGLVILRTGSLRPASLPGPVTPHSATSHNKS